MINLNRKIMVALVILAAAVAFFLRGVIFKSAPTQTSPSPTPATQNDSPKIVSTKPDHLDEAIISGTEVIEITFTRPLENEGEFKRRIDPKIEYEVKLSQDRKTVSIIPKKPYELGTSYTLFILPDSKFDGGGRLDEEKIFHYHTIRYRGL